MVMRETQESRHRHGGLSRRVSLRETRPAPAGKTNREPAVGENLSTLSGSRMRENRPSGLKSGMWKRKLSEFTAPHLDSTRRVGAWKMTSPGGTAELSLIVQAGVQPSLRDLAVVGGHPALKRRAIFTVPLRVGEKRSH